MNGVTNLTKVIEALEADPLLLEILSDVLLYDPGTPDVPYSQPLIAKDLRLDRLIEYLKVYELSMVNTSGVEVVNE